MTKYAIAMLCMLNFHYVLGACIAAYAHRLMINQCLYKNEIDLLIMCDKHIYKKYGKLLGRYFDKVILINLHHFDWIPEYHHLSENFAKKYTWLNYCVNKWQCLKYDKYDKLLFIDIDILPIKKEFYNIFLNSTPCFHHIIDKELIREDTNETTCVNNFKSIDVLNKYPTFNKDIYAKYKEFVYKTFEHGMYSFNTSGPDETTLFYFYQKIHGNMSYRLCDEYLVIPWHDKEKAKTAMAYNYTQFTKPWLKPTFLSWPEELLWRKIYVTMPKKKDIIKLFKKVLVHGYNLFLKSDKKNKHYANAKKHQIIDNFTYDKIIEMENLQGSHLFLQIATLDCGKKYLYDDNK